MSSPAYSLRTAPSLSQEPRTSRQRAPRSLGQKCMTSCDLTSGIPECHFSHLLKDKQVTKASTDSRAQRILTLSFKGRTSKEFTAIFHLHYSSGNTLLSEPGYKASRNLRDLSASNGHSPITDSLGPSCSLYQEPFLSVFCDFSIL